MRSLVQLTLDLFGLDSTSAPRAATPAPPKQAEPRATPAIPAGPLVPDLRSMDTLLAPTQWRHPRANREVQLEGCVVGYEFRRGRRRTIGFSVGPDGLVVSAPRWVPLYEVDKALQEKAGWIVKKLDQSQERQQKMASARIEWADGARFPFLGEPVQLVLDPRQAHGVAGAVLQSDACAPPNADAEFPRLTLHVGLPHTATREQIRDVVQAWLMRQARRVFEERLNHFAPLLQVSWRKLSLSSAGTRWGSASSNGSIRLNWRLVHFRMSLIDYVVVHELSHLRVMDHSPRFWDTVATVVPDYTQRRSQLNHEAVPRWE